ncbi:MAG: recombinase family protein [Alphaproteobacteria bacterium]
MTRAAIYARYSSDLQTDASIEDQVRLCKEKAASNGWGIVECYADHGISGSSVMLRPSVQKLIQDGMEGKYDVLIAEALDRLSRDQEDIAAIYKRMQFAGIKIITLSEGEISNLHVGLKGTMNAMFLKDLADKTRRGLRGRVEKGKSGGGITYGYDVVKSFDANGEPICGERKINHEQAAVVKHIYKEYLAGMSPRFIAKKLNEDGIPCPSGKEWGASTIYGNRQRGTGILNNELYIGQLVWNRLRYIKNPDTGKRVSRLNDEKDWIRKDVPELRIIDQDLWDKVKEKQGEIRKQHKEFWGKQRPKNLFSYLLKCDCCGGGYSKVSQDRYGCSTARNKGTCDNKLTIRQDELESAVLNALKDHLMDEELCKVFCDEYTRHMNELRSKHNSKRISLEKELKSLVVREDEMIEAICNGFANEALKIKMHANEARQKEIKAILENSEEIKVMMHPGIAQQYHKEVRGLITSLNTSERRQEAATLIRSLIDKIVLTPDKNKESLIVDLHGDLAGILSISTQGRYDKEEQKMLFDQIKELAENAEEGGSPEIQDKMVAGVGFEPTTFRL